MTIPTPKFQPGDWAYFREQIATDNGFASVNGKEVERIRQLRRHFIVGVQIVSDNPDAWVIGCQLRCLDRTYVVNERELVNEAEAVAMLELIQRNRKS